MKKFECGCAQTKGYSFEDEIGTVFTRGPFKVEGKYYDYKLEDACGLDYCTESQMESWEVQVKKVLSE